eukprot:12933001-Prorocentrum_lima.AAC.1
MKHDRSMNNGHNGQQKKMLEWKARIAMGTKFHFQHQALRWRVIRGLNSWRQSQRQFNPSARST